ncbi:sensor histidine kinase [Hephaestia sp. GCM10023244]|uniref:sensor histidine kinase n=1 Tax=unclassified Hephaestia TaxID=2631281 RepID=UPI0020772FFE|nr:ATP-binding protein [Hephaestia sp. MAHUQ-44]MCM8731284.1 ATP-binding protein [Hephaestia sp. MAHUQ-44]
MASERRFLIGLVLRIALLTATLALLIAACLTPGLAAARVLAGLLVIGAVALLWAHVTRTNRMLTRFVEALNAGDTGVRFAAGGGAGFDALGAAFDAAIARARAEHDTATEQVRFQQALIDDMPIAVLTIDARGAVTPGNKLARRLFAAHLSGAQAEDYAIYGSTFARRLTGAAGGGEETLLLTFAGRAERAIVRSAELARLDGQTRVVTIQPVQGAFDSIEMAAQSDLVRVLTHEILNSLTPITSLAETASDLLDAPALEADPRVADARMAVGTLMRRTRGLGHFIESYRAVARPPVIARQVFAAAPWAAELARLLAADWPDVPVEIGIAPAGLALDADPDLLAQVLINLLRNGAEAAHQHSAAPKLRLSITTIEGGGRRLTVADNGPGVPLAIRQDVFLPFFTTRAKGTGVGLNLARQIVVAHGGGIEVTDAAGGGAQFEIVI